MLWSLIVSPVSTYSLLISDKAPEGIIKHFIHNLIPLVNQQLKSQKRGLSNGCMYIQILMVFQTNESHSNIWLFGNFAVGLFNYFKMLKFHITKHHFWKIEKLYCHIIYIWPDSMMCCKLKVIIIYLFQQISCANPIPFSSIDCGTYLTLQLRWLYLSVFEQKFDAIATRQISSTS